ncbi:MAG: His/Gly/Thr/Pro-type tRNA ligase C-terminal domain-containing protein [Candidatus Thermoplasmatota archaeon]|nr:His/Gly/Thr/Pro-type tRNA ligase C-terminal domain-containing protein [Candidatus Thermoplasmatota archaeon]MCL5730991.1 His/Gly/Thr/Pro-type tRNA ligase C-terminal domain-containing protein [Candidatus Thermoplasmatota archaeon]
MSGEGLSIKTGERFSDALKRHKYKGIAVVAKFNGSLFDLSATAPSEGEFFPVELNSEDGIRILRHSAAHLLANAVIDIFPGALLNAGPATDDGFFYDIDMPPVSSEQLKDIEREMHRISNRDVPIQRTVMTKDELLEKFKNNPYKIEKIMKYVPDGGSSSVYTQGNFSDFCTGPHVPSTGYIRYFSLTSVASALHKKDNGEEKQLVRIYGTAFPDEESLKNYFVMKEEAAKRDHRRIGSEMDLYVFDSENAPGFPLYAPNGALIREILISYMRDLNRQNGWTEVSTPHVFRDTMWKRSGHYAKYRSDMYLFDLAGDGYAIKPMNCPGHILIFRRKIYSYRDLPVKLSEFGTVYRYEKSGEVGGLTRPRCFTIDDGHAFLAMDQVRTEIISILRMFMESFTTLFGDLEISYELSLIDRENPENFLVTYVCRKCGARFEMRASDSELVCPSCGSLEHSVDLSKWDSASDALRSALLHLNLPFRETPGDAAFYGPKISVYLKDAIGRKWQLSTIQLDFFMPSNFDLTYIDSKGNRSPVVMIHRAVFGSLERIIAILIENYSGRLPTWIAPLQVVIIPVTESYLGYAEVLKREMMNAGIRVYLDSSSETLNKKLRQIRKFRPAYICVVGENEVKENTISVRNRADNISTVTLKGFLETIEKEIRTKSINQLVG